MNIGSNFINCGATIHSSKCSYCGTDFEIKIVKQRNTSEYLSGKAWLFKELENYRPLTLHLDIYQQVNQIVDLDIPQGRVRIIRDRYVIFYKKLNETRKEIPSNVEYGITKKESDYLFNL